MSDDPRAAQQQTPAVPPHDEEGDDPSKWINHPNWHWLRDWVRAEIVRGPPAAKPADEQSRTQPPEAHTAQGTPLPPQPSPLFVPAPPLFVPDQANTSTTEPNEQDGA